MGILVLVGLVCVGWNVVWNLLLVCLVVVIVVWISGGKWRLMIEIKVMYLVGYV